MAWFWIWFNSCSRSSVVATARVCLPRVALYRFDVATLVSRNLYRPQNTRLHLQGAPQRLASDEARRPHLRALSGASRCCAARSLCLTAGTGRDELDAHFVAQACTDSLLNLCDELV